MTTSNALDIAGASRERGERATTSRASYCRLMVFGFMSFILAAGPRGALVFISSPESAVPANSSPQPQKTASKDPDDPDQIQRFDDYIKENRLAEVEPLLVKYLQTHPNSWRAHYQLGYVQFRIHKIGACITSLAKSLELNIKNAEAHKILGLALTIIDKYDEAQIELEQAVRWKPESAEIHYFLGRIYYTKNVFPLAKREFETAIRLNPSYVKAYDNLGLTLEGTGEDAAATAHYRKAIQLAKEQGIKYEWPYINLCAYYNRQNVAGPALENCQKALDLNPNSHQAHFEIGRAYMAQKNWEQAAKALEQAIALDPRSARSRFMLSNVYRKVGRVEESRKEMEAFQELSSRQPRIAAPQGGDRTHRGPDIRQEEAR